MDVIWLVFGGVLGLAVCLFILFFIGLGIYGLYDKVLRASRHRLAAKANYGYRLQGGFYSTEELIRYVSRADKAFGQELEETAADLAAAYLTKHGYKVKKLH